MTPEREKEIRERVQHMGGNAGPAAIDARELLAALDECRRERDDADDEWLSVPVYRYRDKITQTLLFISNNSGSGDYSQVIADMATELLKDLGQE